MNTIIFFGKLEKSFSGVCRYGNDEHHFHKSIEIDTETKCKEACLKMNTCSAYAFGDGDGDGDHDCDLYSGGPYTYGNGNSNKRCKVLRGKARENKIKE